MAQALSELIKRHFFTSLDAREKRRRKERGRRKEPEGGILLSLYPGLLVNKDFSQCPLLFLYPFIPWAEKKGERRGGGGKNCISHHVLSNCFLPYQKQLSSGEERPH